MVLCGNSPRILLKNLIMNPPAGMVVIHTNGDWLDLRRKNLRVVTLAVAAGTRRRKHPNRTGYKGVLEKRPGRFIAHIRVGYQLRHLGTFDSAEAAARAYDEAAAREHGELASLNFPSGQNARRTKESDGRSDGSLTVPCQ